MTRGLPLALLGATACNDPLCGRVAGHEIDVDLVATGGADGNWAWRPLLSVVRDPDEFEVFWEHRKNFLYNLEADPRASDATPEWIEGTQMVLFWWPAGSDDPFRTTTDFYDVDGSLVVEFLVQPQCYPDDHWTGITTGILVRTPILDNPTQCDIQSWECEDLQ